MIEEVEELSPELQVHAFVKRKVLDGGKIRVHKARSGDRRARTGSELSRRCAFKCTGIEPGCQSVNPSRCDAGGIRSHRARLIRVAHLVGAVSESATVPKETHTGFVSAIDHEERESGSCFFDYIHFPVSQDRVGRATPVAAILPALSKGKVVDHAGREVIV